MGLGPFMKAWARGKAGTGHAELDAQQENFCWSSAGTTCCHWASNGVTGQRVPCPVLPGQLRGLPGEWEYWEKHGETGETPGETSK